MKLLVLGVIALSLTGMFTATWIPGLRWNKGWEDWVFHLSVGLALLQASAVELLGALCDVGRGATR